MIIYTYDGFDSVIKSFYFLNIQFEANINLVKIFSYTKWIYWFVNLGKPKDSIRDKLSKATIIRYSLKKIRKKEIF